MIFHLLFTLFHVGINIVQTSITIFLSQVPGLQLKLPGKKLFGNNLDPQFIASRQEGLDMFLQQLMQDKKLLEM